MSKPTLRWETSDMIPANHKLLLNGNTHLATIEPVMGRRGFVLSLLGGESSYVKTMYSHPSIEFEKEAKSLTVCMLMDLFDRVAKELQ